MQMSFVQYLLTIGIMDSLTKICYDSIVDGMIDSTNEKDDCVYEKTKTGKRSYQLRHRGGLDH